MDEILQFCSVVFLEAVDGFALNFNVLFETLKEMLKHFYGGVACKPLKVCVQATAAGGVFGLCAAYGKARKSILSNLLCIGDIWIVSIINAMLLVGTSVVVTPLLYPPSDASRAFLAGAGVVLLIQAPDKIGWFFSKIAEIASNFKKG